MKQTKHRMKPWMFMNQGNTATNETGETEMFMNQGNTATNETSETEMFQSFQLFQRFI